MVRLFETKYELWVGELEITDIGIEMNDVLVAIDWDKVKDEEEIGLRVDCKFQDGRSNTKENWVVMFGEMKNLIDGGAESIILPGAEKWWVVNEPLRAIKLRVESGWSNTCI